MRWPAGAVTSGAISPRWIPTSDCWQPAACRELPVPPPRRARGRPHDPRTGHYGCGCTNAMRRRHRASTTAFSRRDRPVHNIGAGGAAMTLDNEQGIETLFRRRSRARRRRSSLGGARVIATIRSDEAAARSGQPEWLIPGLLQEQSSADGPRAEETERAVALRLGRVGSDRCRQRGGRGTSAPRGRAVGERKPADVAVYDGLALVAGLPERGRQTDAAALRGGLETTTSPYGGWAVPDYQADRPTSREAVTRCVDDLPGLERQRLRHGTGIPVTGGRRTVGTTPIRDSFKSGRGLLTRTSFAIPMIMGL